MPGKIQNTPPESVDPDDSPEWTAEMFEKATPIIGEREVTWNAGRGAMKDIMMASPPYKILASRQRCTTTSSAFASVLPVFRITCPWSAE
jgi:hypothetical protein